MDILTHTLSGFAVGTLVSSFSLHGFRNKLKIFSISGIAGALPDLDAISLWGGFDSTIGRIFNLSHSGNEIYYSKFWYSHHGFLHSIFAALLLILLIGLIVFMINTKFRVFDFSKFALFLKQEKLIILGFLGGFLIHLFEDMPTPSAVWGGVNLFWPSKNYIGGTGDIWWWNNYDIFLIVLSVTSINLIFPLIRRLIPFDLRKVTIGVFAIGLTLSLIQIKTRDFDFAYSGHTKNYNEFEIKSKELQKDILGDKIFLFMEDFDNKLRFYF